MRSWRGKKKKELRESRDVYHEILARYPQLKDQVVDDAIHAPAETTPKALSSSSSPTPKPKQEEEEEEAVAAVKEEKNPKPRQQRTPSPTQKIVVSQEKEFKSLDNLMADLGGLIMSGSGVRERESSWLMLILYSLHHPRIHSSLSLSHNNCLQLLLPILLLCPRRKEVKKKKGFRRGEYIRIPL